MKRVFISIICLFSTFDILQAQTESEKLQLQTHTSRYPKHEFSAYASFGVSNINYKLEGGSHSGGAGLGLGFNYAYNINSHIAVVTGLGFASYSGSLNLNGYSADYNAYDDVGDKFTMHYSLDGEYSEKHSVALLSIPVMARYSTPLGASALKFFASGGFKIGIPVIAKATIASETVSTSGYYEYENYNYTNLPEHGFVNGQLGDRTSSRIRFSTTPLLSLETGIRIPIGYVTALTAGLYLDYSLTNVQQSNDRHIVEYQSLLPAQFNYNSALNTAVVGKITLFNAGLKIGVTF